MAMFVFIFILLICLVPVLKQCMNQHSCRCDHSPDLIDKNPVTPSYDFDNPIYYAEEEGEEDCELSKELARKEVKVGAALEVNVKSRMVALLKEYVDIFAWSYQDMPGLDTDIVVHKLPLRADCPPVK
ncbi:hypothetical protein KIW84_020640 [Lathyrus oleraceus]|uniref:Uncharacterized protein n=1 Tax=Pisum sativum TaxID=3888 RepID=A0A9D4Y7P1_PEA|nr:hypothetical protein KIW84_020640 [Pisum sativum]